MNAGKHIYDRLLAERMKRWVDLVRTPLINRKVPPSYARRQFRNLLRKHPLIAAQYGFTEESVMTLPPRVLERELLPSQETRQQFPVDVTDSSPSQRQEVDRQASTATGVVPPRMVGLEGEVL